MRKGIILNLKRFKLLDYVTLNKIFIILCVLFIAGIILGSTLLLKNSWLSQNVTLIFKDFLTTHSKNTFFKKFFICVARYILILVFYFLSGASMLGIAITPFVTVWQGILFGSVASHLYATYGLGGIAFNAMILIPPLTIFIVCCFFAAKCAIDFSLCIAKLTMPKSRPANLYIAFKDYCFKYLIFIGISIICTFIEIFLNQLCLKFFNF